MAIATEKRPGDLAGLVRTHQAGIWRYLRFLGADETQADDLTQDVFLAVLGKPFVEHSATATSAYLRTVARNLFLMSARRRRRQPTIEQLDLADEVWERLSGDDGEAALAALRDCVESLEGRARQAVEMFYRQNRSRADIARELEMSEDGVKSLLRRTREVLRKCVEGKLAKADDVDDG
ncbi:MAG TPA: sigma-70 family RNA polymerase sigma factor [Pirellulales bacterium]|jgi:RNA polymerase sigma-70 factor (ECF subfamily)|nr:sigma-70 family RNA polymerase sigma factor [Pirellulales bacterium]